MLQAADAPLDAIRERKQTIIIISIIVNANPKFVVVFIGFVVVAVVAIPVIAIVIVIVIPNIIIIFFIVIVIIVMAQVGSYRP